MAAFAFESGDPLLRETLKQFFPTMVAYATPRLKWAAYFIRQYGEPSWEDNIQIWKSALSAPSQEPEYAEIGEFPGINTVVIHSGPLRAALCN